jgi:hypothetical protein
LNNADVADFADLADDCMRGEQLSPFSIGSWAAGRCCSPKKSEGKREEEAMRIRGICGIRKIRVSLPFVRAASHAEKQAAPSTQGMAQAVSRPH